MRGLATVPHHDDASWMRRALSLARRSAGAAWPNPTVAACIVREGRLLAEAVHDRAGEKHAEAKALDSLESEGGDATGTTVYVTLEPCNHHGKTPPCSQRLVDARVARVVYAVEDRSPRREEAGAAWLAEHGVEIQRGPLSDVAWELNHPFFETASDDEVHWTLKLALSIDGKLASRVGRIESAAERAVTGERVRRRVHRMRAGARAILVGRGTAEADQPRLDLRHLAASEQPRILPQPVILDSSLRLDPQLLPASSLVFASASAAARGDFEAKGHVVSAVGVSPSGGLDWAEISAELASRGLGIVMAEGGATVASDLLEAAWPHRVHLFLAGRLFGSEAPGLRAIPGFEDRYRTWRVRRVGPDIEWVLRRSDLPLPGHR